MTKLVAVIFILSSFTAFSQELYNADKVINMELQFYDNNYKELLEQNKEEKIEIPALLIVEDTLYIDSVGVRYKGNSSYNIQNDKKSFNISINAYIEDQRLWGYKTLNLNNGFVDPTFMRERIANQIFSKYLPALKTGYVYLNVNGEEYGLYSNVQQINKDFIGEWYDSKAGNVYKGDPRGELSWKGNDPELYKSAYEKKTNEDENDWSDLVELINVINNSTDLENELPQVLNADRALWYFALCNVFVNLDSYIFSSHNYYLYNNPATGKFDILPWDLNEAFGVFPPDLPFNKEVFPPVDLKAPNKTPLLKQMLSNSAFLRIYFAHYRTILKEYFNEEAIVDIIDEIRPVINDYVQSDPMKLYSFSQYQDNIEEDVQASGRRIPGILSFVSQRTEFLMLLEDLNKPSPMINSLECITHEPTAGNIAEFNVEMESENTKNVEMHFRIGNGSFESIEMFDDGNHSDGMEGDKIYGCTIDIPEGSAGNEIDFYATATNNEEVISFYPERAEFEFLSVIIEGSQITQDIVINEFMASNSKTIQDPQGAYPDWIELYNNSDIEVHLNGWYLTDDPEEIQKWQFPDIFIDAAGYLLIWADKDTDDEGLHTNFKLSKSGEYIGLYDNQLNLIDSYTYSEQSTDISKGRYPNGSGSFVFMEYPTPGSENMLEVGIKEGTDCLLNAITISPNPVIESSVLSYKIDKESNVKIDIINSNGNKVKTLYEGTNQACQHRLLIPGNALTNGLYICRIKINNDIHIKKFVVNR
ncbi:CotH kinase family protein [Bacteroidota bacterium]